MSLILPGCSPVFMITGILTAIPPEIRDEDKNPEDTGEKEPVPSDNEIRFVILCVILWFIITVFLYPEGATPPGFD